MAGLLRPIKTARTRSRDCCNNICRALKVIGWIPPKQGILRYVYIFWMGCVFVLMFYLPFGFVLSILKSFKNFTPGEFLGVVEILLNAIGMFTKSFVMLMFCSRLQQVRPHLDILDECLQTEGDRRKIHKAVSLCNNLLLTYGKVYLGYTLSVFIVGVITGHPPWLLYNPFFDWRDGVAKLWMQAILEYMILSIAVIFSLTWDTYPPIFIVMIRAHVDILKDHIRNLRTDSLKTETTNYKELVSCIIYHKLILKCCNLIRPIMSRTIFLQFLLIGMLLGVTLIDLLNFSNIYSGLSSMVYLFGIVLQTFPFCYLCDLLVADSTDLSNLLSQSQWIDAESKYKSTLLIFLHQVQQPIIFIAGGVFTISLTSNFKMAKIAFSVMTLVQQMNLAERFE